eukprot:3630233-Alexandrium_andersonii.AAC.1
MSASLVGSEMCIRDRFCPALSGCVRPCPAVSGSVRLCPALSGSGRLCSCLLYTSDAADDM